MTDRIKLGAKVRILPNLEDFVLEFGWVKIMLNNIGKEFKVTKISKDYYGRDCCIFDGNFYPFECLEKVEEDYCEFQVGDEVVIQDSIIEDLGSLGSRLSIDREDCIGKSYIVNKLLPRGVVGSVDEACVELYNCPYTYWPVRHLKLKTPRKEQLKAGDYVTIKSSILDSIKKHELDSNRKLEINKTFKVDRIVNPPTSPIPEPCAYLKDSKFLWCPVKDLEKVEKYVSNCENNKKISETNQQGGAKMKNQMINNILTNNKEALVEASKIEGSRLALKALQTAISNTLPENMQAFANTPFGMVALANIVSAAVPMFLEDGLVNEMSEKALTAAYMEVLQTLNLQQLVTSFATAVKDSAIPSK